jgi:peptidoglycan/xylan/chitin deacetylase (PgdA/CDA1 family)
MRLLWRSTAVAVLLLLAVGWGAVAAADPPVRWHGPRDEKVVALTFDDGWSTPRCQKIVDILLAEKVAATFFPNALYVKQHPAFWRKVAALGFPIGNHTVNHRDLTELNAARVFKEIDRDREIVEKITGVPMIRAMRPPFGAYDKQTIKQSARAGFPTLVLWDVTSLDTSRRASKKAMTRAALSGRSGSIVVLHCGPKETPQILPRIIEGYRARGFRFVTIPALLGIAAPSRQLHRPWAWSLLHSAPSPVVVATAACPPPATVAAAGTPTAGASRDWRRTGWSRRPSSSCVDPATTALSSRTSQAP